MKHSMNKMMATACLLLSMTAHAGFDEGMAAYNKKDFVTALKKLTPLANQGDARAQNNLGVMYVNGQGVPQDYDEAVKLFRLAADQGHVSAQYNLGVRYGYGQGVPQNYTEAVKWYRLAAVQGDAFAQSDLGFMYSKGQGVLQSRVIAFALYNVSAANDPSTGNKAAANRDALSSLMTAAEIAAGQSLSQEMSKPGMLLKALDKYSKKPSN